MKQSQYDSVAEQYEYFIKNAPLRKIDEYSVLKMVGDVSGKSVLDLACGYGFFSRKFYFEGASKVVGVDISEEMINIAIRKAAFENMNIRYIVSDVKNIRNLGKFDLVSAVWLFNYASSLRELYLMLKACYESLKLGGRLIAYTINPEYSLIKGNYIKYGFNVLSEEENKIPICMQVEFITPKSNKITTYRWRKMDYEMVINTLGFNKLEWVTPEVPTNEMSNHPNDFWNLSMQNPLQTGFICTR